MIVGLLGDVHANGEFLNFALWKMNLENISDVIQVGDFGIGQTNYNARFLRRASVLAAHFGITVHIVPGNHEDHVLINELIGEQRTDFVRLRDNLLLVPRGMRWQWGSSTFVGLGGAPSVDMTARKAAQMGILDRKKHSWFPEEMITEEDLAYVAEGGYADIMLCHDAPNGVSAITKRISSNPMGFDVAGLAYAEEGREKMTRAFRSVAPKTFVHGHYHFPVNEMVPRPGMGSGSEMEYTHILGLGCDGSYMQFSMGHYDTETKIAHMWNSHEDHMNYNRESRSFVK